MRINKQYPYLTRSCQIVPLLAIYCPNILLEDDMSEYMIFGKTLLFMIGQ